MSSWRWPLLKKKIAEMNTPIILTPGPVRVPDFVLDAIRKPPVHHRSSAFQDLFQGLQAQFQYLFQTESRVLLLGGSGTFAVELAMKGVFREGERVLVLNFGKFGDRWAKFGRMLGLKVEELSAPWGESPDLEAFSAALSQHSDWAGIVFTHCDTSTGAAIDLEEMCFRAREQFPELILLADTISTVGVTPLYVDAWGLDVAAVSSPKALMNPAGTVFLSVSERAEAKLEPDTGDDYFSLSRYVEAAKESMYPVTPPTQLFYGIEAALAQIQKNGLPACWNRSHQLSQQFKAAVPTFGGELFGVSNGDAMTAFSLPGKPAAEVLETLRLDFGIEIAGGQSGWKGKLLRVAHFGSAGKAELDALIDALTQLNGT